MRADAPSFVTVPAGGSWATVLDFLDARFPRVGRPVWAQRLAAGAITEDSGRPAAACEPCRPHLRLSYFREVAQEPLVPFAEEVLFQDEHIVVACKPHFLPVIPSGPYVQECLLNRLRRRLGNPHLVPVNRIDRETAGLVLFSARRDTRALYAGLFRAGLVQKRYEAVALPPAEPGRREWLVANRLVDGTPWFLSREAAGPVNARSRIRLLERRAGLARFELEPLTGKRHQLRLHLAALGSAVINDPYYPLLRDEPKCGYDCPLQLLARGLAFTDPVSGAAVEFVSPRRLALAWW